ncbi:hypothetical protein KC217_19800, partial [Mycobacterium tuberculosis]|nr:hypothetical protein [Mycobacterium tuberculosis]
MDQLDRWKDGRSKAPLFAVAAICRAAGRSVGWLLGEGSTPDIAATEAIDPELFGRVVDRVSRVYREEGVRLSDIDLGRIAAERYA